MALGALTCADQFHLEPPPTSSVPGLHLSAGWGLRIPSLSYAPGEFVPQLWPCRAVRKAGSPTVLCPVPHGLPLQLGAAATFSPVLRYRLRYRLPDLSPLSSESRPPPAARRLPEPQAQPRDSSPHTTPARTRLPPSQWAPGTAPMPRSPPRR